MIERGAAGEIYLRCESGDMVVVFRDRAGRIVIQLPSPGRGLPHAALSDLETKELSEALLLLLERR